MSDPKPKARRRADGPSPRELAELLWLRRTWKAWGWDDGAECETLPDAPPPEPTQEPTGTQSEPSPERRPVTTDTSEPTDVEVSLPDQDKAAPGRGAERVQVGIEASRPIRSRLAMTRGLHRLATWQPSANRHELDIPATVRSIAAAGGQVHLVFRPQLERYTRLVVLMDRAATMAPWHGVGEELADFARETGSFAEVDAVGVDLEAQETLVFTRSGEPVRLESLCPPGSTTIFLLISDGLGGAVVDGRLGRTLRGLGEHARVAWLHPWGAARWKRTPAGQLRVGRVVKHRDGPRTQPLLPIAPLSVDGFEALESWARGRPSRTLLGRKLPVERGSERDAPRAEEEMDWMAAARRFCAHADPTTLELMALAAAIPGRGLDLELLIALAEHFEPGPDGIQRHHLGEALSSGFFRQLDAATARRVVVGFIAPEAREALLSYLDYEKVGAVLEWLFRSHLDGDGPSSRSDLEIPIDLLIRIASREDQLGAEDDGEHSEETLGSLRSVLHAARSERWKAPRWLVESGAQGHTVVREVSEAVEVEREGERENEAVIPAMPELLCEHPGLLGREEELRTALFWLTQDNYQPNMSIVGSGQSGRSTFVAALGRELRARDDDAVVVMHQLASGDADELLSGLVQGIKEAIPDHQKDELLASDDTAQKSFARLISLSKRMSDHGLRCFLIVDDIDRLEMDVDRILFGMAASHSASSPTLIGTSVSSMLPHLNDSDDPLHKLFQHHMDLPGLDPQPATQLVRGWFRDRNLDCSTGLALWIHEQTEGSIGLMRALFTGIAKTIEERGIAVPRDGEQATAQCSEPIMDSLQRVLEESLQIYDDGSIPDERLNPERPGRLVLDAISAPYTEVEPSIRNALLHSGLCVVDDIEERLLPNGPLADLFLREGYGLAGAREDQESEESAALGWLPDSLREEWEAYLSHPTDGDSAIAFHRLARAVYCLQTWLTAIALANVRARNDSRLPKSCTAATERWAKTPTIGSLHQLARVLFEHTEPSFREPLDVLHDTLFSKTYNFAEIRNRMVHGHPDSEATTWRAQAEDGLRHSLLAFAGWLEGASIVAIRERKLTPLSSASKLDNYQAIGLSERREHPRQETAREGIWLDHEGVLLDLWPLLRPGILQDPEGQDQPLITLRLARWVPNESLDYSSLQGEIDGLPISVHTSTRWRETFESLLAGGTGKESPWHGASKGAAANIPNPYRAAHVGLPLGASKERSGEDVATALEALGVRNKSPTGEVVLTAEPGMGKTVAHLRALRPTPAPPVPDNMVFGRATFATKLAISLGSSPEGHRLVLYGQRWSGVSTVLRLIERRFQPPVVPISLSVAPLLGEVDLAEPFVSFVFRVVQQLEWSLSAIRDQKMVKRPWTPTPSIRDLPEPPGYHEVAGDPRSADSYLREAKTLLTEITGLENVRICLLVDDFSDVVQELWQRSWLRPFTTELSDFFSRHNLSVLLAAHDGVRELLADAPNFAASLHWTRLGSLDREAAVQLIAEPTRDATTGESRFEDAAVDRLIALSGRDANTIQLLCAALIDRMNGKRSVSVTEYDVMEVADSLVGRHHPNRLPFQQFEHLVSPFGWRTEAARLRGARDLDVLKAIAHATSTRHGCTREDLRSQDLGDLDHVLSDLLARGVLEHLPNGNYRIAMGLFAEWLRQAE